MSKKVWLPKSVRESLKEQKPKLTPKPVKKVKPRSPRICISCGKEFYPKKPWSSQRYCWSPCHPKRWTQKNKTHCDVCGRKIRTRIPLNSSEQALCSFCQQRKNAEKRALRENQYKRIMGRCKNCGDSAYLYYGSGLCHCCYIKSKNPHVLDVQEIREVC